MGTLIPQELCQENEATETERERKLKAGVEWTRCLAHHNKKGEGQSDLTHSVRVGEVMGKNKSGAGLGLLKGVGAGLSVMILHCAVVADLLQHSDPAIFLQSCKFGPFKFYF